LLAVGTTAARAEVRADENRRLGADGAVVRGRDVATVAVNPSNPNNIVTVDEDFVNSRCTYRASFDGGTSWTGGILTAPPNFEGVACSRFDIGDYAHVDVGSVAFGTGQNVYVTFSWNLAATTTPPRPPRETRSWWPSPPTAGPPSAPRRWPCWRTAT